MRQAGQAPVQEVQGDLPFLSELDLRGDVTLLAAGRVAGPILGQVEPAVQRGVAGRRGVGEEDADLAVVHLAEPAAPLAGHAARLGPLLGEGAGVDDHDAVGLGQLLADVLPQLAHDGLVVPLARTHEELDRLAGEPGLDGDRLARLAFQAAEEPRDDRAGMGLLRDAVEPRQVPPEEAGQAVGAVADGVRTDRGVVQEGLSLGMIQERHRESSVRRA